MDADNVEQRFEQLMASVRGTARQGQLWALHDICTDDKTFLEATVEPPKVLITALKKAMKDRRKRISSDDLEFARKSIAKKINRSQAAS
ncbi:MAG: hypothetical protein ACYC3O_07275 [Burkholderiales bacterium]